MQSVLNLSEVLQVAKDFQADFINPNGEIIIHAKKNIYAYVLDAADVKEVEARVVMSMMRPISKGQPTKTANELLHRINYKYAKQLTRADFEQMYIHLCYSRSVPDVVRFIAAGFPMDRVEQYGEGKE